MQGSPQRFIAIYLVFLLKEHSSMRNLIKFLSRYKGRIAIMLLLLFIQVVGTLYIPTLTADIVNNGIAAGDLDYVWKTGRLMLIVALSTAVFSICSTFTSTYISTALGRDIRGAIFHKVQDFSISDFRVRLGNFADLGTRLNAR